MSFSASHLAEARAILDRLDTDVIERMAVLLAELRARKGRLFFLGVGGSAGNCGHAVNDFRKIAGIESYAPTDKNARPYMADGCQLVVTVPGGPRSQFDVHIGHREHFSPARLHQVLTEAGFKVEYATGAGFPFFNLYRSLVVLRGSRLIAEASEKPGLLLRVTSALFRILFRLNISRSSLGWQTLAVARK